MRSQAQPGEQVYQTVGGLEGQRAIPTGRPREEVHVRVHQLVEQ